MSIEYNGLKKVFTCKNCKKIFHISLKEEPPTKCQCSGHDDPWLYPNAILQVWSGNSLDRKTIVFTGQKIEDDHYIVRGTPWENVPVTVQEITIDEHGQVFYEHDGYTHCQSWITCPESLLWYDRELTRPEWTKYLPGIGA